ncbi:MAG: aminoacyl-tRNA hydrolase [Anaerolineae bacterium]|jgi:PTH1 family peptidyl-tRNA hydrolase|nr:aminoacyl-tRNA hydrolase [Anaerolineae bacterium]
MTRYLIVGLGNPGKQYEQTKHNVGFWTVDELARRHGLAFGKPERKAISADGLIGDRRVLLAKPQTYMNLSGESVRPLLDFYKIELDQVIVISDDLDLPIGTIRLRKGGSHGGQNGLRSIIQHLGTQEFNRVRIGIGRPPGRMEAAAYVLHPFEGDDAITMRLVIDHAANAVETWLKSGIDLAMTRHNGKIEDPKPTP